MTEQHLVERCREGNREAQRELYDRTSEHVYRLLLKMTGNPDDAFDLSQETYLKAFARIGQFDGRSAVTTWLYRIAVNEALQLLRRAGQARDRLREITPENSTESNLERSTVKLDVTDALAALAPKDRAMLLLRYQEGLDYRSIAEVTGLAAGTVASRLNRARQGVRAILQKSYIAGEETGLGGHPNGVRQVSSETGREGKQRRTGP